MDDVGPQLQPLAAIAVALARIEERQEASGDRIKDMADKIDTLVSKESYLDLVRRVKTLEGTQSWLLRTIVVAVVGAVASLFGWAKSH